MLSIFIQVYLLSLILFVPASLLLSAPAFYILHKKNRLCIIDFGFNIVPLALLSLLASCAIPVFSGFSYSNLAIEPLIIALVSILACYSKIFIPHHYPSKVVSIIYMCLMLIITACIFFFFPVLGE